MTYAHHTTVSHTAPDGDYHEYDACVEFAATTERYADADMDTCSIEVDIESVIVTLGGVGVDILVLLTEAERESLRDACADHAAGVYVHEYATG